MEDLYSKVGEFVPDNLIAGNEYPILVEGITLAKNQGVVERGTVVGIVSATGLAVPVDSAQADGSQTPYGVLTDDIDTGDGAAADDFKTTAYVSGLFNSNALIFGGTDTAADHKDKLRELGIFLRENQA